MSRVDEKMARLAGQFRHVAAVKAYQYTVVLRRPAEQVLGDMSDAPYYIAHVRAADTCQAIHGARAEVHAGDVKDEVRPLCRPDMFEVVAVFFGFCDIAVHSFQVHESLREVKR